MRRTRITVLALAGLLLLGVQAGFAATDAAAKRAEQAHQWAAEHPESCALLDNPKAFAMMDNLALKLAVLCDRPDLLGQVAEDANESPADALGTDVRVNDPTGETGSRTQSETSIGYNETTGTLCSGYNDAYSGVVQGQGYTGFSSSTDGGVTWVDRGALGSRSFGDPGVVWRKMDGKFYFVALDSNGLGIWRSDDDCQTFSFIANPHVGGSDDKELMAIDNNVSSPHYGRIYVSWTDFTSSDIFTVTSDNGTTWSSPALTSQAGNDVQGAWPAIAPNGDVYVTYIQWNPYSSGPIDAKVAKSTNGGSSFAQVTAPMSGQVNPRDSSATNSCGRPALNGMIRLLPSPQIAIGTDGVVHEIYSYDPDGFNTGDVVNVYYRRSLDGGATWQSQIQLNDDATTRDQFQPTLSVGAGGIVSASWYDRRDDAGNLRLRYYRSISFDNGATWQPNVEVTDADSPVVLDGGLATCYHGDYDTQTQTGSQAVLIWSDDRGTEGGGNNADTWSDSVALSNDFLVSPTPASRSICAGSNAIYTLDVLQFNGFSEPVTLAATGLPGAATAGFSSNPVVPGNSSDMTISNTGALPTGSSSITVTGTSSPSSIVHDASVTLNVFSGDPGATTLTSPADNATGVSTTPTFTWTAVADATDYLIEVDDNSNFSSPEFSATVTGTSATPSVSLGADTHYYWRVTTDNPCGSTVSGVFEFDTALEYCSSPGLAIPDNTTVSDTMTVPDSGTVQGMQLSINADHTYVGDLTFTVTHVDTGTTVELIRRPLNGSGNCSGDDIDTLLDDSAGSPVQSQCGGGTPTINGTFSPENPLAGFVGESINGDWRISVTDSATLDTGVLNQWCLVPTVTGGGGGLPFNDGFESGDTSAWSAVQP